MSYNASSLFILSSIMYQFLCIVKSIIDFRTGLSLLTLVFDSRFRLSFLTLVLDSRV